LDPWLVNAKDVKHLPGRPKTDRLDAVWLCKVAERQMLRSSFVPPADIRRLRDLTQYRIDLVGSARRKTFDDHHRFLLARMLARVDAVDADIAAVDTRSGSTWPLFADAVARLDEIPGIGPTAAAIIIAEIGLDMTRFPTPAHLASWAKSPPDQLLRRQEQGQRLDRPREPLPRPGPGRGRGRSGPDDTFLGARYRRLVRRRGKKKAIVAVGRSTLVIIWHLLADPDTHFDDLGADHYDRHLNTQTKRRNHVRQLEALGYHVTLEPAA
jgi:transposase